MCRATVRRGDDWAAVYRRLGKISAAKRRDDADLVAALLDDLWDPGVRQSAVKRARSMAMALSEGELRKVTTDAALLVDRICPDQSFSFRAGLTSISLWVTENS